MQDPYNVLGLSRNASNEDIKRAYRKLSKEWHPDKHKGEKDAETKFKAINEAYEILSDPQKRKMFDQFGTAGGPGSGFHGRGFPGFDFSGFQSGEFGNISEIFESFFGGRGGGRSEQTQRLTGEDLELELHITLQEAVQGAVKHVSIKKSVLCTACTGSGAEHGAGTETCSDCGGTGQVEQRVQSFFGVVKQRMICGACRGAGKKPKVLCKVCSGEGRIAHKVDVPIQVPPGIADGQTLRIRGQGGAGARGAAAGDLYVTVRMELPLGLRREGDDVHAHVQLPLLLALLGGEVSVPTVHGEVRVTVDPGVQPGHLLRVKGKGFPVLGTSRFGDHYAELMIEIPKKISRKEREVLEHWKEIRGEI